MMLRNMGTHSGELKQNGNLVSYQRIQQLYGGLKAKL